jgi:fatty acid desaturase
MVPSYNLKKLHNIIKDQIPRPFPSLFSFYKQVLPIVIKQATDPSIYFKTNIPEKHK